MAYTLLPGQTQRFCHDCEEIKPASDFTKKTIYCRSCRKEHAVERREDYYARDALYPSAAEREEYYHARRVQWEEQRTNPRECFECGLFYIPCLTAPSRRCWPCTQLVKRANFAVNYAEFKKELGPRGLCVWCQSTEAKVYHHEDYHKPLEVLALCHRCHTVAETNKVRRKQGKREIPWQYY